MEEVLVAGLKFATNSSSCPQAGRGLAPPSRVASASATVRTRTVHGCSDRCIGVLLPDGGRGVVRERGERDAPSISPQEMRTLGVPETWRLHAHTGYPVCQCRVV